MRKLILFTILLFSICYLYSAPSVQLNVVDSTYIFNDSIRLNAVVSGAGGLEAITFSWGVSSPYINQLSHITTGLNVGNNYYTVNTDSLPSDSYSAVYFGVTVYTTSDSVVSSQTGPLAVDNQAPGFYGSEIWVNDGSTTQITEGCILTSTFDSIWFDIEDTYVPVDTADYTILLNGLATYTTGGQSTGAKRGRFFIETGSLSNDNYEISYTFKDSLANTLTNTISFYYHPGPGTTPELMFLTPDSDEGSSFVLNEFPNPVEVMMYIPSPPDGYLDTDTNRTYVKIYNIDDAPTLINPQSSVIKTGNIFKAFNTIEENNLEGKYKIIACATNFYGAQVKDTIYVNYDTTPIVIESYKININNTDYTLGTSRNIYESAFDTLKLRFYDNFTDNIDTTNSDITLYHQGSSSFVSLGDKTFYSSYLKLKKAVSDTSTLQDGYYTFSASMKDLAENTQSGSRTLLLDKNAPYLDQSDSYFFPEDNDIINYPFSRIQAVIRDDGIGVDYDSLRTRISGLYYGSEKILGASKYLGNNRFAYDMDSTNLTLSGNYEIRYAMRDSVVGSQLGNSSLDTVRFVFDKTAPSLTSIYFGDSLLHYNITDTVLANSDSFYFTYADDWFDAINASDVSFTLYGPGGIINNSSSNRYGAYSYYKIADTLSQSGIYSAVTTVADSAGNSFSDTCEFYFHSGKGTGPSVNFIAPSASSRYYNTFPLPMQFTLTETDGEVDHGRTEIKLYYEGNIKNHIKEYNSGTYNVYTYDTNQGEYMLKVTSYNIFGSYASDSITFVYDSADPLATQFRYESNTFADGDTIIGDTIDEFSVLVGDSLSGIDTSSCSMELSWDTYNTTGTMSYSGGYLTMTLLSALSINGSYTLETTIADSAGNSTVIETDFYFRTESGQAPDISVLYPSDRFNSSIDENLRADITSPDGSGVGNVSMTLYYYTTAWSLKEDEHVKSGNRYTLNTYNFVQNGEYRLDISAQNSFGVTRDTIIYFVYDNTAPDISAIYANNQDVSVSQSKYLTSNFSEIKIAPDELYTDTSATTISLFAAGSSVSYSSAFSADTLVLTFGEITEECTLQLDISLADSAGNTFDESYEFFLDKNAPYKVRSYPSGNTSLTQIDEVWIEANDLIKGIDFNQSYISGLYNTTTGDSIAGYATYNSTSKRLFFTLANILSTDAPYEIRYTLSDGLHAAVNGTFPFILDTTEPSIDSIKTESGTTITNNCQILEPDLDMLRIVFSDALIGADISSYAFTLTDNSLSETVSGTPSISAGLFTFTSDSTLANSTYTLSFSIEDNLGNNTSVSKSFTYHNGNGSAPQIQVLSPATRFNKTMPGYLKATILSTGSGVSNVSLQLLDSNNTLIENAFVENGSQYILYYNFESEEEYNFRVYAENDYSQDTLLVYNFIYDPNTPVISNIFEGTTDIYPLDSRYLTSNFGRLGIVVSDTYTDYNSANITLSRASNAVSTITSITGDTIYLDFNALTEESAFALDVAISDSAGNGLDESVTFYLDKNAPYFVEAEPDAKTSSTTVNEVWVKIADDIKGIEYGDSTGITGLYYKTTNELVTGNPAIDQNTNKLRYTMPDYISTEGTYEIRYMMSDGLHGAVSSTYDFIYDVTPPEVLGVITSGGTSISEGSYITDSDLNGIVIFLSDNLAGIDTTGLSFSLTNTDLDEEIDGSLTVYSTGLSFGSAILVDGNYEISLTVYDSVRNVRNMIMDFNYHNGLGTAPTVDFIYPVADNFYNTMSSELSLRIQAADGALDEESVEIKLYKDGSLVNESFSVQGAFYTMINSFDTDDDGTYTLLARASSIYSQETVDSINFVFDDNPLAISQIRINSKDITQDNVLTSAFISIEIYDSNISDLSGRNPSECSFSVQQSDNSYLDIDSLEYDSGKTVINFAEQATEGEFLLRYTITDSSGNELNGEQQFFLDTNPPYIRSSYPANSAAVNNTGITQIWAELKDDVIDVDFENSYFVNLTRTDSEGNQQIIEGASTSPSVSESKIYYSNLSLTRSGNYLATTSITDGYHTTLDSFGFLIDVDAPEIDSIITGNGNLIQNNGSLTESGLTSMTIYISDEYSKIISSYDLELAGEGSVIIAGSHDIDTTGLTASITFTLTDTLENGEYTLSLEVYDALGNENAFSRNFAYHNGTGSAPEIVFFYPPENLHYISSPQTTFDVALSPVSGAVDYSSSSLTLYRGDEIISADFYSDGNHLKINFDLTQPHVGPDTFSLHCSTSNIYGVGTQRIREFVFDNISPDIQSIYINDSIRYNSSLYINSLANIKVNVADNLSPISMNTGNTYIALYNYNDVPIDGSSTAGSDSILFTPGGQLADAPYYFNISVYDSAGNFASDIHNSFVLDQTPPANIGHLTAQALPNAKVRFDWSVSSDLRFSKYNIKNYTSGDILRTITDINQNYDTLSFTQNIGSVMYFTVCAYDSAGNMTTGNPVDSIRIQNVPQAPTISQLSLNTSSFNPEDETLEIGFMISDNSGSQPAVYMRIFNSDDELVYSESIESVIGQNNMAWDGNDESGELQLNDKYEVTLEAIDTDFNSSGVHRAYVYLDTYGASFNSTSASPNPFAPDGNGISDSTFITFEVANSFGDDQITIYIENSSGSIVDTLDIRGAFTGNGIYSAAWGGTHEDGLYKINFHSVDIAGNITEFSPALTLNADNKAPEINVVQVLYGENVYNNYYNAISTNNFVLIEGNVVERNFGSSLFYRISYETQTGTWQQLENTEGNFNTMITFDLSGTYRIDLKASDIFNHESMIYTYYFGYDPLMEYPSVDSLYFINSNMLNNGETAVINVKTAATNKVFASFEQIDSNWDNSFTPAADGDPLTITNLGTTKRIEYTVSEDNMIANSDSLQVFVYTKSILMTEDTLSANLDNTPKCLSYELQGGKSSFNNGDTIIVASVWDRSDYTFSAEVMQLDSEYEPEDVATWKEGNIYYMQYVISSANALANRTGFLKYSVYNETLDLTGTKLIGVFLDNMELNIIKTSLVQDIKYFENGDYFELQIEIEDSTLIDQGSLTVSAGLQPIDSNADALSYAHYDNEEQLYIISHRISDDNQAEDNRYCKIMINATDAAQNTDTDSIYLHLWNDGVPFIDPDSTYFVRGDKSMEQDGFYKNSDIMEAHIALFSKFSPQLTCDLSAWDSGYETGAERVSVYSSTNNYYRIKIEYEFTYNNTYEYYHAPLELQLPDTLLYTSDVTLTLDNILPITTFYPPTITADEMTIESGVYRIYSDSLNLTGEYETESPGDSVIIYTESYINLSFEQGPPLPGRVFQSYNINVKNLRQGEYNLYVSAIDQAGNIGSTITERIAVMGGTTALVISPLSKSDMDTGKGNIRIRTAENAESAEVMIYDLAGDFIRKIEITDGGSNNDYFTTNWDLKNYKDNYVKNGPYIFVITIDYGDSTKEFVRNGVVIK